MKWKELFKNDTRKDITVSISKDDCMGCGRCIAVCRRDALRMHYTDDKATVWVAYSERCSGCGRCQRACSFGAVRIDIKCGEVIESI